MIQPNKEHMKLAIEAARKSKTSGDYGHGAIIVRDGVVISSGYETLKSANDPVNGHAEVDAIRKACEALRQPYLENCILYSTAELCPMCISACIWAKIDTVAYGISREDMIARMEESQLEKNGRFSWRQIAVSASYIAEHGEPRIDLIPGFMRQEALELL